MIKCERDLQIVVDLLTRDRDHLSDVRPFLVDVINRASAF